MICQTKYLSQLNYSGFDLFSYFKSFNKTGVVYLAQQTTNGTEYQRDGRKETSFIKEFI